MSGNELPNEKFPSWQGRDVAEMELQRLLDEVHSALVLAAKETRDEFDGFPRNLLAAYYRVNTHVEFILRVANPKVNQLRTRPEVIAFMRQLCIAVANATLDVGLALHCQNGFLEPSWLNDESEKCKQSLLAAADLIDKLASLFSAHLARL